MALVQITGNTVRDAGARPDNRPWKLWAASYQDGGNGGVITPGADAQVLRPVAGRLRFKAEAGKACYLQNPDGDKYLVTIPEASTGLWDVIEAGVAYPPETPQELLNAAVAAAAPAFVAAELEAQTADAVTADLESRAPQVIPGDTPGTVRNKLGDAVGPEFPAAMGLVDGLADAGTVGKNVVKSASQSTARSAIGATSVGSNVFTSATEDAARDVIFAASRSYLARNARDAGIDVTGSVDETTKINAYLQDAFNNQRDAHFPRGDYLADQVAVPSGLRVTGAGVGGFGISALQAGTRFRQPIGANKPLVVFTGNINAGFLNIGPVDISGIVFVGRPENSAGSAIAFQAADGTPGIIQDTTKIHDCFFRYWPEHGIEIKSGARPLTIDDCMFLWNGGAGVWFEQNNQLFTQSLYFHVSGDGNPQGLLHFKNLDKHASATIVATKSERRVNPNTSLAGQDDCLIFENCDDMKVTVLGGTHISSVPSAAVFEPPGAFMVVKGGTGKKPQIYWTGLNVRVRGTDVAGDPCVLRDEDLDHRIPVGRTEGFYGGTDGQYKWADTLMIGREDELAVGESTHKRTDSGLSGVGTMATGSMRLSFFTAQKTELINSIQIPCGTTVASGTAPTLVKAGLYVVESNGDLTLIGSGAAANLATVFTTANTENTFTFSAAAQKIRGKRYAVGLLIVGAGTMPTVFASTSLLTSVTSKTPRISHIRGGQSDLPSTVTAAQLSTGGSTTRIYAEVLP